MQIFEKKISLLYVDDEPSMLDVIKSYLEHKENFIVDTALSGEKGLLKIREQKFDAVVSDYQMPKMNGLEFLRTIRSKGNNIPFIIFTGRGGEEVAIEALNEGADYYLRKGKNPKARFDELQNFIRQAVEKKRAEKEVPENERRMTDVIKFLPDATFATDTEGRVITWNEAVEEMTGTSASEILGKGEHEHSISFYGIRRPLESIREISEYKQKDGLYKTIFENTGTAMAIIEDENTISHINEKMKELMGYSGYKGKDILFNWQERVLEEDREKVIKYHRLRRTDPDSLPNNYDFRLIHKNGEVLTVNMTTAMIPGTNKNIVSFIDITEKAKSKQALLESEFKFKEIFNSTSEMVFLSEFSHDEGPGRFIEVNDSMCRILDYTREELLHMSPADIRARTKNQTADISKKFCMTEKATFECMGIKKDGTLISFENISCCFMLNNRMVHLCIGKDISERKKAEQALTESENKFREIFNKTNDIIFVNEFVPNGPPGRFIEVNDAACRILGYKREEMLQLSIDDIKGVETNDKVSDILNQFKIKGKATFEAKAIKKDRSRISIEINAIPFELKNRRVMLSVGRDISERKQTENTLKTLNKKLNLLSSITRHDISNHISVLTGYEELLKEIIDDKTAGNYLKSIIKATDMIQKQIAFTHDYQGLGLSSPTWQPVESIALSVISNLPGNAIKIKIKTDKLEIYADHMLEKIFFNLFENSIRHGKHVTEFSVSFIKKEKNGILVIEDNGKGIPDNMKGKIFERGFGSNTGLGLFLTREILEITGIYISETGTEGRGARFEIVVPKDGYRFKNTKDPDKTNLPGSN